MVGGSFVEGGITVAGDALLCLLYWRQIALFETASVMCAMSGDVIYANARISSLSSSSAWRRGEHQLLPAQPRISRTQDASPRSLYAPRVSCNGRNGGHARHNKHVARIGIPLHLLPFGTPGECRSKVAELQAELDKAKAELAALRAFPDCQRASMLWVATMCRRPAPLGLLLVRRSPTAPQNHTIRTSRKSRYGPSTAGPLPTLTTAHG